MNFQLRDIVATLRREIDAALQENKPLPRGARMEAERVVVRLQFEIEEGRGEGKPILNFDTTGKVAKSAHSLTIEFKCASTSTSQSAASADAVVPGVGVAVPKAPSSGTEDTEAVKQQLSSVLGVPGFDSAARATVFREALENLSDTEMEKVIHWLAGRLSKEETDTAQRAVSLLQRVIQSGPAGLVKGKEILAGLFQHRRTPSILALIANVWKSQEDWMS